MSEDTVAAKLPRISAWFKELDNELLSTAF